VKVLARVAYRCAYLLARAWWFVRRPRTSGAMVALWNDGRLVRSSYRYDYYSLPGGFVKRGERPLDAALRELAEELAVTLPPPALSLAWEGSVRFEHRDDAITIWEGRLDHRPEVTADGREIVWAGWMTADEARAVRLLPHLRAYLARIE
jgi:8-oxo-dGTP diphosphatase